MRHAMSYDYIAEVLYLFLRNQIPKFSRQGDVSHFGDILFCASCLFEHLSDKGLIHHDLLAVSVQMSLCQFYGFTQHDAEGKAWNT